MSKFILYYHTLKYLKCKQLFFRLWYKLYHPKISLSTDEIKIKEAWANNSPKRVGVSDQCHTLTNNSHLLMGGSMVTTLKFIPKNKVYFINEKANFLNHAASIASKHIWNDPLQEKLWLYNLNYFDALNACDAMQREWAYSLLQRWIKENPCDKKGNAWEPYPISLRIVNIIKYALSGNTLDDEVKNSLYIQARFLNKTCEYHLLGNHLFENFKALCFAGLFFEGIEANQWFNKGLQGLKKEVKEQILEDGGHFELSPMYHCIILEGLLALEQVFTVYAPDNKFPWKKEIEKMLVWLSYMMRNEDSISYFNDAADGIAHTPCEIFAHAKLLGYRFESLSGQCGNSVGVSDRCVPEDKGQKTEGSTQHPILTHLKASGYIVVEKKRMKAILDVARIGPDYLPGHAHADTLSFELMIDGFPVFVNLGTSCYGNSERRIFERSTKAHNTLVVDDENSSEVWSGFRVARRAKPELICIDQKSEGLSIVAEHDGYKRLTKPIVHKRVWQFAKNRLTVTDILENEVQAWANNPPKRVDVSNRSHTHTDNSHLVVAGLNVVTTGLHSAKAYLHLHPDCQIVSQQNRCVLIALPNGKRLEVVFNGAYEIQGNQYAVSFGQLAETKSICYLCETKSTTVSIKW